MRIGFPSKFSDRPLAVNERIGNEAQSEDREEADRVADRLPWNPADRDEGGEQSREVAGEVLRIAGEGEE